jgi:flavin-dependent dehydrogenase
LILKRDERPSHIVIAGAGPAGTTIATLLALRGKHVTLVDPGARRTDRLEIIAPAGLHVIQALNLTPLLDDPAIARPCLGIRRRWGTRATEIDDFLRRPGGRGFVIERARFDDALHARAAQAGANFVSGRVVAVRQEAGTVTTTTKTGSSQVIISAGVTVDATGRASAVARRVGAQRLRGEPRIAECRWVDWRHGHCDEPVWLNVQGFEDSWRYQLLGPGGRQESWAVYPPLKRVNGSPYRRVDASSACLSRPAKEGLIAVGDAVTSFDPIASQGLANALSTALVAAGALLSRRGLDEGACAVYSEAVLATFRHSEANRLAVYQALKN